MTVAQHVRKRMLEAEFSPTPVAAQKIQYEDELPRAKPVLSNNFLSKFLGSSLVIMTVATFAMLVSKNYMPKPQMTAIRPVAQLQQPVNTNLTRSDIAAMQQRFDRLENEFKVFNHRVWLLGVAHNENINIMKQQGMYAPQSLVFFNEQWQLNRMPTTLTMTDLQRFEIQPSVVGSK